MSWLLFFGELQLIQCTIYLSAHTVTVQQMLHGQMFLDFIPALPPLAVKIEIGQVKIIYLCLPFLVFKTEAICSF